MSEEEVWVRPEYAGPSGLVWGVDVLSPPSETTGSRGLKWGITQADRGFEPAC